MKKVLTEDYYGRLLEVTITQSISRKPLDFIPDSVKEVVFNSMADDADEGEFTIEETGDLAGSWRFHELNYYLMLKIVLWQGNHLWEEGLNKILFIKYFGDNLGEHIHEKWYGECNQDLLKMISYFRSDWRMGQVFCNMLMEQVNKYTQRGTR